MLIVLVYQQNAHLGQYVKWINIVHVQSTADAVMSQNVLEIHRFHRIHYLNRTIVLIQLCWQSAERAQNSNVMILMQNVLQLRNAVVRQTLFLDQLLIFLIVLIRARVLKDVILSAHMVSY